MKRCRSSGVMRALTFEYFWYRESSSARRRSCRSRATNSSKSRRGFSSSGFSSFSLSLQGHEGQYRRARRRNSLRKRAKRRSKDIQTTYRMNPVEALKLRRLSSETMSRTVTSLVLDSPTSSCHAFSMKKACDMRQRERRQDSELRGRERMRERRREAADRDRSKQREEGENQRQTGGSK